LDFRDKSLSKNAIFAGYSDDCLRRFFFEKEKKQITPDQEIKAHQSEVKSVSLSAKRGLVATGCKDGTARLWDCQDLTYVATLVAGNDNISSLSFGQDQLIAAGSWDQTVKLFEYSKSI